MTRFSSHYDLLDACLTAGLVVLSAGVWLAYGFGAALIVVGAILTLAGLAALAKRVR